MTLRKACANAMFCTKCRCELPDGVDFCPACGTDLRAFRGRTPPPGTPGPTTPFRSIGYDETILEDASPAANADETIDDRYEILEVLGAGGMGTVYRVLDRHLGEECALKVMNGALLASEKAVERFVQEARVSRKLTHANIVRVYHLGEWNGQRYLTMELMNGRTLRAWMETHEESGRPCPVDQAAAIVRQLLDALEYAHRFTIHRDIKPENVFLIGEEPDFRVRLLDFGIARGFEKDRLTRTRSSLGTPFYMAPEQRKGAAQVDPRADLYAVAVLLYELLTGAMPTGAFGKPSEERPELDPAWDAFVLAGMDRDPERRPADAAAMRADLDRLIAAPGGSAPAGKPAPVEQPEHRCSNPRCGRRFERSTPFCPACGTAANATQAARPRPQVCANPACRRALRPGVSFCTFCGRSVH